MTVNYRSLLVKYIEHILSENDGCGIGGIEKKITREYHTELVRACNEARGKNKGKAGQNG